MTTFRRVTVTIPETVLEAADQLAADLDRSRSWVVAEGLRRLTAQPQTRGPARFAGEPQPAAAAVRESVTPPHELAAAFRAAEQARIESDLALTPEERVRIAEEIARTAPASRRPPRFSRVMQFETFEDYLDWKRFADLEP